MKTSSEARKKIAPFNTSVHPSVLGVSGTGYPEGKHPNPQQHHLKSINNLMTATLSGSGTSLFNENKRYSKQPNASSVPRLTTT